MTDLSLSGACEVLGAKSAMAEDLTSQLLHDKWSASGVNKAMGPHIKIVDMCHRWALPLGYGRERRLHRHRVTVPM